jgi:hypothetical protein
LVTLSERDFFVPSVDNFAVVSEVTLAVAVVLIARALLPPKEKAPVVDGAVVPPDPVVVAEEALPNEKDGVLLASVFVTLDSTPPKEKVLVVGTAPNPPSDEAAGAAVALESAAPDAPNEKVLVVGAVPNPPSDEAAGAAAALESAAPDAPPNEKVLVVGAAPNPLPVPKPPPANGFEVSFDLESAEAAAVAGAPPKLPKVFEAAVPSD